MNRLTKIVFFLSLLSGAVICLPSFAEMPMMGPVGVGMPIGIGMPVGQTSVTQTQVVSVREMVAIPNYSAMYGMGSHGAYGYGYGYGYGYPYGYGYGYGYAGYGYGYGCGYYGGWWARRHCRRGYRPFSLSIGFGGYGGGFNFGLSF